ncbi:hypothetical protein KHQ81_08910 [Mycoplasmatota bacterium]|nr:hypothetical protein KHQ81_08910 [Mycoplasmatota bacterium]
MSYKNGGDILPPKLLRELQKHIQGELIYIPKEKNSRAAWGEHSGSKKLMDNRNLDIFNSYIQGESIKDLASKFCLSEDSIKKIISKNKKKIHEN